MNIFKRKITEEALEKATTSQTIDKFVNNSTANMEVLSDIANLTDPNTVTFNRHTTQATPLKDNSHDNIRLLKDLKCVQDVDTKEWNLVVSFSVNIGSEAVYLSEKEEFSKEFKKKIDKLREHINEKFRNSKTLIDLLS